MLWLICDVISGVEKGTYVVFNTCCVIVSLAEVCSPESRERPPVHRAGSCLEKSLWGRAPPKTPEPFGRSVHNPFTEWCFCTVNSRLFISCVVCFTFLKQKNVKAFDRSWCNKCVLTVFMFHWCHEAVQTGKNRPIRSSSGCDLSFREGAARY